MGDEGVEYDENELFNAWVKQSRKYPKQHTKSCHDKCGCYKPKELGKISTMSTSNLDIDNFDSFNELNLFISYGDLNNQSLISN